MNNTLVKVNLHHDLGKEIGESWDLAVDSVAEAVRAIESVTQKLYKYLIQKDKENIKYQIIVNGEKINCENIDKDDIDSLKNSELCLRHEKLESIDIIPVIEGANSKTLGVILGVILIIIAIVVLIWTAGNGGAIATALFSAGTALIISSLLSKPPKFEEFREISQGGRTSYLYNGPVNIVGEGGPVPVGYGRLIVGSQTVAASYVIREFSAGSPNIYVNNIY